MPDPAPAKSRQREFACRKRADPIRLSVEVASKSEGGGAKHEQEVMMLGAGAIGSSISADVTKAGYDVTVIDQWPAQVEELKKNGLHIQMPDGDVKVPVRALHYAISRHPSSISTSPFSPSNRTTTAKLAEFIKPYLKNDGVLVGTQNGMNDDTLASIVGHDRTIGCAMELSAEISTPGLVKRNTSHKST